MATVLVVGAAPAQESDLQQLLGAAGHDVRVVDDPTFALGDLGSLRPDLMVIDLEESNEIAPSARAIRGRIPHIPLLTIAHGRRLDDQVRCLAETLGAECVLLRPFDAGRMVELADRILASGPRARCDTEQLEAGVSPEPVSPPVGPPSSGRGC